MHHSRPSDIRQKLRQCPAFPLATEVLAMLFASACDEVPDHVRVTMWQALDYFVEPWPLDPQLAGPAGLIGEDELVEIAWTYVGSFVSDAIWERAERSAKRLRARSRSGGGPRAQSE